MAQVVLFRPPEPYSKALRTSRCPLGLIHIAAPLLERGISVAIIDGLTEGDWRGSLRRHLGDETICAGVSVMTGSPIRGALEFAEAVKQLHPVPVVFGGIHPSMLPEQTAEHDLVDLVIVGEGEESFLELVESLRSGGSLEEVPNLYDGRGGRVRRPAAEKRRLDLDRVAFPAYDLIDVERYVPHRERFLGNRSRCLDLNTDRGCPYRCAFCYNLQYNQRRWRALSAGTVLERIERLVHQYRLAGVNFVSDNFFVNTNRVAEIAQGILDRRLDITWHADLRVDMFLRFDNEFIDLVKRSGCVALTFGAESGSDRMLSLLHKDITVAEVKRAHERAVDRGFLVNYHFMVGLPDETRQDVLRTLELISYLTRSPETALFGPTVYRPYPGTPLFQRALELGFEPPKRLEEWINHDFHAVSDFPWISKSHRNFIDEAVQLTRFAFGTRTKSLAGAAQLYARLRYARFQRGVRLGVLDARMGRLVRSAGRRAA